MARKNMEKAETRTIVLLDAVNFTHELKTHGKSAISPKISKLRESAEFFFVFKVEGGNDWPVGRRLPNTLSSNSC